MHSWNAKKNKTLSLLCFTYWGVSDTDSEALGLPSPMQERHLALEKTNCSLHAASKGQQELRSTFRQFYNTVSRSALREQLACSPTLFWISIFATSKRAYQRGRPAQHAQCSWHWESLRLHKAGGPGTAIKMKDGICPSAELWGTRQGVGATVLGLKELCPGQVSGVTVFSVPVPSGLSEHLGPVFSDLISPRRTQNVLRNLP